MSAIGGYFGLELRTGSHFHPGSYALNTGRNALALALRNGAWRKVHVPQYTCSVVFEAIRREKIEILVHPVDEDLELVLDPADVGPDEVVLLTAYFGLKRPGTERWSAANVAVILDAALSFYSSPLQAGPTFYSCRKFFGVPDGSYLVWPDKQVDITALPEDSSLDRFAHLLKRIDRSAEDGFADYQANEQLLDGLPLRRMSKLTEALMASVDHDAVKRIRRSNFKVLHEAFRDRNQWDLDRWFMDDSVPMIYPLLVNATGALERLRSRQVYLARYWPEVAQHAQPGSFSLHAATSMLALPLDQRYTSDDMVRLIREVEFSLR
jgi:hypothetical protein